MPTLSVMKAFSELGLSPPNISYAVAQKSLRAYHSAGVPILAGTDANSDIAAAIAFGESFHSELELMVEAGMGTLEALRAATVLPAMHWGLDDRGVIAPGKRADLVLIRDDPIEDIRATRNIIKVWVAGAEFEG
jgi:imidazolonepropionase-like amidohydrolase